MTKDSPVAQQPAAASALTQKVYDRLAPLLAEPRGPRALEQMLRLLAKWRASVLLAAHRNRAGSRVLAGPFAGMEYLPLASEGSTLARLLGIYESPLHPIIETAIGAGYAQVVDIGCAEGYYAVGLARRMPQARVYAHDSGAPARAKCAELAALNGVTQRVQIGGEISHADLALCARGKTLVVCDIEGAEDGLLDPAKAPALTQADILVEVHDCFDPGLSARVAARFAASHDVQIIHRREGGQPLPDWMNDLSDIDRVLVLWEWRSGPTPWLWMQAKTPPKDTTTP